MELLEPASQHPPAGAGDAAAFVLSRLPHPDTVAADDAAFVDAATGGSLSFFALRWTGLSLASGLRRGDAVLILSPTSPLLLQIILGVLAAGGVVAAAEIAAAAQVSGAVIVVAAAEVAGKVAGVSVPLLLTLRSLDPRTLSAEELIDGGDLMPLSAPELAAERPRPGPSDVAFVSYSSASTTMAMTHADLVAAMASAGLPEEGRVCLACLPTCSLHGLLLLALGLPSAGVTMVLMPPPSDPRASWEAVAAHSATDAVAAPEVTAALAAPMPQDGKLSTLRLRRVTLAPAPLAPEARQEFHRRLTWVELAAMEMESASEQLQVAPAELGTLVLTQHDAAVIQ